MGTIGTVGGYYQLANLLSSGSGSSGTSSSASSLQSLEQALLGSSGSGTSSGSGDAFLLDLSPQAQSLLSGTGTSSTSSSSGSSTEFTLTSAQETQIKDILEKYKDAPLDQQTFNEIQNALQAAGLSPQTLGAQDQIKSFNPTNVLLSALDGNYASISTPGTTESNEQTKESNYMQGVVSLWKSLDTGASSGNGTSSAAGSSS